MCVMGILPNGQSDRERFVSRPCLGEALVFGGSGAKVILCFDGLLQLTQ